jgi:hypothetical protein
MRFGEEAASPKFGRETPASEPAPEPKTGSEAVSGILYGPWRCSWPNGGRELSRWLPEKVSEMELGDETVLSESEESPDVEKRSLFDGQALLRAGRIVDHPASLLFCWREDNRKDECLLRAIVTLTGEG